ncbi:CHAT domain-containing protein [Rhodofomes roseus]|uniref:CHAT domain-containing protein n=1 Tax=Rhodofomes roseus TaxID=34475 RepID=A0ABQ8K3H6_9APHY|nr:CHAT domain-containing protein [Rhodofomes roseus]KAH9831400.1 CHAT domain-containing protein [Rhodofomes roseus]
MNLPDDDPHKAEKLHLTGLLFHVRYRLHADAMDILEAATAQETAVKLLADDHPDKPNWLVTLAKSLHALFQRKGSEDYMLDGLAALREAIELTPTEDPAKLDRLALLALTLYIHYSCFSELANLHEGLEIMDELTMGNPDHSKLPEWLSTEAGMHLSLFHHLGNMDDLDNSIGCYEIALLNLPEDHPERSRHLSNAGSALLARFERLKKEPDIKRSIALHEQAVKLTEEPDVKAARLISLAQALFTYYGLANNASGIDQGVAAARTAVEIVDSKHPSRPHMLIVLAKLLRHKFTVSNDAKFVDEAITILKQETHMTPTDHPDFRLATVELGHALIARFNHQHAVADIDRAVEELKTSLHITGKDEPQRPALLNDLGDALLTKFSVSQQIDDVRSAVDYYSQAVTSEFGVPAIRLYSAMQWAATLQRYQLSSPLSAYQHAVELLSQVAWLGLPMTDRYTQIMPYNDLVCNAATAAIREGKLEMALEWLEQGRSIVWGQILQLRTAVSELSIKEPDLAQQFMDTSKELEALSNPHFDMPQEHSLSVEVTEQRHRSLAKKWASLVKHIQSIDGFASFLKPKAASQLMQAAVHGPCVIINISQLGSDALIIMPHSNELQLVLLPQFPIENASKLQNQLNGHLMALGINIRKQRAAKQVKHLLMENIGFPKILSALWTSVVLPIIQKMALKGTSDTLPHVFWCLTGPLTFLPLHAAGQYETEQSGTKLADYAISSYTPTLTALLDRTNRKAVVSPKLLGICQSFTPGQPPLYAAQDEVNAIVHLVSQYDPQAMVVLKDSAATVEQTLKNIEESDWIHLACHGVQDMTEPTSSAIILWDGSLSLADVIKLSLQDAELAFLSACETATGDNKLSEEAVHLAAGMLLAGYKGVIATMWSIQDEDGPVVAEKVYAVLLKGGIPNAMKAAQALHDAVLELQKSGASFERWVPFIHMGV